MPEGCYIEWTGQFEHEVRAHRTLAVVIPIVVALIFRHPLRDLPRPGRCRPDDARGARRRSRGGWSASGSSARRFSVTIWVGYIACFGMATATGVIMLVYLRGALEQAGGIGIVDGDGLRRAVLEGAAQRLRPKLLTEATIVLGLAPMLWAGGVGGEVIRPMAAPVLGGILVADEVIDLLLPVLFYRVRRHRLIGVNSRTGGSPVAQAPRPCSS